MSSNSSKRRDGNRQRDLLNSNRATAEARTWARWQDPSAQPGRLRLRQAGSYGSVSTDTELLAQAHPHLDAAISLFIRGLEHELLVSIELLTCATLSSGRRAGVIVLEEVLAQTVRTTFTDGWQPLDLVHVVSKHHAAEHRSLLVATLSLERATSQRRFLDDRWERQLCALDVNPSADLVDVPAPFAEPAVHSLVEEMRLITDVRAGIELLVGLRRLPKMPVLIQPPSAHPIAPAPTRSASEQLDEKVLATVRGLLAKAESTTFDQEADALTAKAQQLMARHAIDLAMIDAGAPSVSGVVARRVHVEDPYFEAKAVLLTVVAEANRCSAVMATHLGIVTVFGFPADLDITELLFTSLLTQATSSMVAAGRSVDRTGTSRTKSFRRTFIIAFALRVGERLREAAEVAADDARTTFGGSLLPVLASRNEQVMAHQTEVFPNVRTTRSSISNAAGWHAGRTAADNATLNAHVSISTRT